MRQQNALHLDKARFADLRQAVKESKDAGGVIDYQGPLSRASVDCNALRCTHIECDLFNIREDEFVLVEVSRSQLPHLFLATEFVFRSSPGCTPTHS